MLALGLAAAGLWSVRHRFGLQRPGIDGKLANAFLLVVLQAVLVRAAVEWAQSPSLRAAQWSPTEPWLWTPWFLTTGLAAMLLGSRLGILTGFSGVFMLYLRADPGPLPLVGCMIASLYGVLLLRRPTRHRALRAGVLAGTVLGGVAAAEALLRGSGLAPAAAEFCLPVLLGLFSAFAVLAVLPVLEWILGELSDVTLVEYASEHPLLDRLKEEAPGTWHHSLNVADLAEKAAAAVAGRALFCRTTALYHDIGKLKSPLLFAENMNGRSLHDDLDPQSSAQRIIEHVAAGLELAREHRLPKPFRDIISEHHGDSVVRFFYTKACAQLGPDEDPEAIRAAFCYPGPRPASKESAIIALADVVEAATRSADARSHSESRAFVRKLIADRIAEGQLAECPLTLAELAQIEETFIRWVEARGHHRPAYRQGAGTPAQALPQSAYSFARVTGR
jgi:hypothetical protein